MKKRTTTSMMILAAMFALSMTGCSSTAGQTSSTVPETDAIASDAEAASSSEAAVSRETITFDIHPNDDTAEGTTTEDDGTIVNTSFTGNATGMIDSTTLFTERDLLQTPDLANAQYLTVSDNSTLRITEAGVYVISGSASNCTIQVDTNSEDKVQLVLSGVNITNDSFPAIYVTNADKVFVTLSGDNKLAVTGSFIADGETNTDAVIFAKDDLVLNGTGSLALTSAYGNGITCKDDLKITGGTYTLSTALDAFEANDSISVCGGTFAITTQKDGFHCVNDEAEGSICITDGTFRIQAASDGVQAAAILQIDGGSFTITASEGLEATYIQINGGMIDITASDDGINASNKSNGAYAVVVEFNGGDTTISMGQGDTDAVDANGSIYVNSGTINITAPTSSFDYDQKAEYNGGTIIINGEQVSEIPQSMMGGPGGFGGWGGQGNPDGQENWGGQDDWGGPGGGHRGDHGRM